MARTWVSPNKIDVPRWLEGCCASFMMFYGDALNAKPPQ
jgi:hypothetical protein